MSLGGSFLTTKKMKSIKELKTHLRRLGFDRTWVSYGDHTPGRKEYHMISMMRAFPIEVHYVVGMNYDTKDFDFEIETIVTNRTHIVATDWHPISMAHLEAALFFHSQIELDRTIFIQEKAA